MSNDKHTWSTAARLTQLELYVYRMGWICVTPRVK